MPSSPDSALKADLANWLRSTRKAKGIPASELAAKANISVEAVYQYERGEAFPRGKPHIIPAFEEVLGCKWRSDTTPNSTPAPTASAEPPVMPTDAEQLAKVLAELMRSGNFEIVIRPRG